MKRLRYLTAAVCLFTAPAASLAQPDANYVKTASMLDSIQNSAVTTYQFYDGRGRLVVTATNGLGTAGNYVYTLQAYDAAGNVSCQWLPVAGTPSIQLPDGSTVPQMSFSQYSDSYGYSSSAHDALGRQTESVMPGEAWHTGDRKKTVLYLINKAADNTSFPAGFLTGELAADEDGHALTTWYDLRGLKVQEDRGADNSTRYIYNSFGQLVSVRQGGPRGIPAGRHAA